VAVIAVVTFDCFDDGENRRCCDLDGSREHDHEDGETEHRAPVNTGEHEAHVVKPGSIMLQKGERKDDDHEDHHTLRKSGTVHSFSFQEKGFGNKKTTI
jgi:hypothetical protein